MFAQVFVLDRGQLFLQTGVCRAIDEFLRTHLLLTRLFQAAAHASGVASAAVPAPHSLQYACQFRIFAAPPQKGQGNKSGNGFCAFFFMRPRYAETGKRE